MEEQDNFPTSDFPLASFLYASGVILKRVLDIPNDSRRKLFVFDQPDPALISLFQSGKAEVNVLALNNAQNALRAMTRGS